MNVIEDYLNYGHSKEVDFINSGDYYKTLKVILKYLLNSLIIKLFYIFNKKFTLIYGCGSIIANRLYENGELL